MGKLQGEAPVGSFRVSMVHSYFLRLSKLQVAGLSAVHSKLSALGFLLVLLKRFLDEEQILVQEKKVVVCVT